MSFVWSYTALDTFEQCPERFYHRYILKEKEPPSPALIKGNEVHKSCEEYLKGNDTIEVPSLVRSVKEQSKGKKLCVELKMGLNGLIEPVGFFDDHVWGRSAADVIIIDYPNAMLIDWKTGKVRERSTQLAILALFVFRHFPRVEKITACNVWLEHGKFGEVYTFTRAQEPGLWAAIMPKIQAVENAVRDNQFCMMPGPLCKFCFVKSCPNNRS